MMLPSCQPEETVDTYMSFMERSGLSSFSYFFMAIPEVDPSYAQETPPGFSGHSKARMLAIRRSQEEAFNDGIFFPFHFPSNSAWLLGNSGMTHRIGWWENFNRKALYLMVKTMVSCRFSLKPIQWMTWPHKLGLVTPRNPSLVVGRCSAIHWTETVSWCIFKSRHGVFGRRMPSVPSVR